MDGTLNGLTVLDHSTVGPASRCTQILADLGASVVKIGPVGGDRWSPPWWAYGAGRGTTRARFNLKDDGAREAYLTLAGASDVVVESFRPGVADRLGIGYEASKERNPAIVYCATSGYGATGPYAQRAGHDLNYLGVGGFLATQGTRPDGAPALPGATVADSAGGGMHAAISILAALLSARATGVGRFLDVSTVEGVLAMTALNVEEYLATAEEPAPGTTLLTGKYACYDVYEARDGRWLAVGAIEPKFFENLCAALGLDHLAGFQMVDERQDELREALRSAFATKDRDAWVTYLADADCCVSPVLSVAEVVEDAHLRARGAFTTVHGRDQHGFVQQVAPMIAGAMRAGEFHEGGDLETAAVLARAGMDAGRIEELTAAGVIE